MYCPIAIITLLLHDKFHVFKCSVQTNLRHQSRLNDMFRIFPKTPQKKHNGNSK